MPDLPLIRNYADGAALAYRAGQTIDVAQFLHDVSRLAASLPERRHLLNLCVDRYHFCVGFAAALLRRQISLLPPNHTPHLIEEIRRHYPDVYCLADKHAGETALETVVFPQPAGRAAVTVLPAIPAAQTAAIVFTSGSTGQPMPHRKTWGGLVRGATVEAERLRLRVPGAAILGTVPPQHMYGLESTVLLAMHNGLAFHAGRPFYPDDICVALAALPRPRALVTTPIHLRALLAEVTALPRADLLVCATAPLSPQLAAAAEACFAAPLYEIYGCTEAGQVATRRTADTAEWQALPGMVLRQDQEGTWVGGGHAETEVRLNDVIEMRGREKFLLHGRTADLVNVAGKRTSLANLNYHLNSVAGVRDGVFVVPNDEGEKVTRLAAFVVAPGLDSQAVMDALRQRIDAAFLPRPLCFVESLPRNETGKLARGALDGLMAGLETGAG